jgi:hypothetical protein
VSLAHLTAAPPGWPLGDMPPLALIAVLLFPIVCAWLWSALPPEDS